MDDTKTVGGTLHHRGDVVLAESHDHPLGQPIYREKPIQALAHDQHAAANVRHGPEVPGFDELSNTGFTAANQGCRLRRRERGWSVLDGRGFLLCRCASCSHLVQCPQDARVGVAQLVQAVALDVCGINSSKTERGVSGSAGILV